MTPGALDGIAVLDLTWNLPGPYASFVLASLGATVTKVEPPRGDPARHMPGLFTAINREKRSLVLDLQTEEGRTRLHEEIRRADVLLEGFRPGVAARLGCGADAALATNPRLVYCSISAWGQDGPLRDVPGHDLNAQALAGACHLARDARGRPHGLALPVADLSASMSAVASIGAALYARERDGKGRVLDVAMVDGVASWANVWAEVDLGRQAAERVPRGLGPLARRFLDRLDRLRLHALPHYDLYRCGDGQWLALGVVDEKHFWTALCATLGLRGAESLPMPARALAGPVLRRWIGRRLRSRPRDAWLDALRAAGVPASPVLTPREALAEPHVAERLVGPRGTVRAPVAGARHLEGDAPVLGGV